MSLATITLSSLILAANITLSDKQEKNQNEVTVMTCSALTGRSAVCTIRHKKTGQEVNWRVDNRKSLGTERWVSKIGAFNCFKNGYGKRVCE